MKRTVIYAHYDENAQVKAYVLHTLRSIREISSRIVFVSTSPLSEVEQAKLAPLVDEIVLQENRGFDFAMWRGVLLRGDLIASSDEILLLNSSIFGPSTSLKPLFERMSERPVDFWALTGSNEFHWHLQSYFLVFRRTCLEHPSFRRFWESVLTYASKQQVIFSYELGLTRYLTENGLKSEAVFSETTLETLGPLEAWRVRTGNPTLLAAAGLIRSGMPFLKLEVLRHPRFWLQGRLARRAFCQAGYDASLIEVAPR